MPGQIITQKRVERVDSPDPDRDILKLVVVERHRATGNIGLGLVAGFGLRQGAIASSIAHDSHNIIAVGASDEDLFIAIKEVERLNGGLVLAAKGKVSDSLALPIAGLLAGPLTDLVLEPGMGEGGALAGTFGWLVGTGPGAGIWQASNQ